MKKVARLFLIGFFLLACYSGYQNPLVFDLTQNKNNTLSKSNREILLPLKKPLTIELITPDQRIHEQVKTTISLFQRESKHILFKSYRDLIEPEKKQALGLKTSHYLLLTHGDNTKAFDIDRTRWSEKTLGSLIYQTLQQEEQWVVFLSGHGEQHPSGKENRHLNRLSTELKTKGINIAALNLAKTQIIPDNTKILVIANNQSPFLPLEIDKIIDYLSRGGNLLWLASPNASHHPQKLEEVLGIKWLGGTILDPKGTQMGTPHPAISVITQYPKHPITQLDTLSIFPWSTPLEIIGSDWTATPLLKTNDSSYLEMQEEQHGPFIIGAALTKADQRIVIIGNSYFLSNSSIHNYGNLDLANNIFSWLNEVELLPLNHTKNHLTETNFVPSFWAQTTIQYFFPYLLSLTYLCLGWQLNRIRKQKAHLQ